MQFNGNYIISNHTNKPKLKKKKKIWGTQTNPEENSTIPDDTQQSLIDSRNLNNKKSKQSQNHSTHMPIPPNKTYTFMNQQKQTETH